MGNGKGRELALAVIERLGHDWFVMNRKCCCMKMIWPIFQVMNDDRPYMH
jgi:hypothetical protein